MTSGTLMKTVGNECDGSPFAGERVCFYVDDEADSYRLFSGTTGPGRRPVRRRRRPGVHASRDRPGRALRVPGRERQRRARGAHWDRQSIDVIAECIDEGLLRDRDLEFGNPSSGDPTPPPNTPPPGGGPTTPTGNGPGTTAPTAQEAIETIGRQAAQRGSARRATR